MFYAVGLKGSLFAFFAAYFATICTGVGARTRPRAHTEACGGRARTVLARRLFVSPKPYATTHTRRRRRRRRRRRPPPPPPRAGIAYTVAAASPTMDVANAALPVYVSSLLYFAGARPPPAAPLPVRPRPPPPGPACPPPALPPARARRRKRRAPQSPHARAAAAGFLLRFEDIPPWWRWFSYANPLRYAWTALMVNQFGAANPRFLGSVTVLQYFGIEGQPVW